MLTIPELQAARKPPGFRLLRCPHCSQALNPVAPLVVSTRNCPSCGRRVVAEPESNATPPAFTPEQLEAAHATAMRAQSRTFLWVLAAFLGWFVLALLAVFFQEALRDAAGSAAGWIVLGAMGVIVVFAVAVGLRVQARSKATAPACPHCDAPLYHLANLARLTGNCPTCGRRLCELPPDEPARPLPTVEEFKVADRRANRSIAAAIFLLAVMLAVPGGLSTFVQPERIERMLEPRYGFLASTVVAVVFMFVWVIGLLAVAIAGVGFFSRQQCKRRKANPVLVCLSCKEALVNTQQVVASQRCPACRRRVLTDPDPVTSASGG